MRRRGLRKALLITGLLGLVFAGCVSAAPAIRPEEYAFLPEFCRYVQTGPGLRQDPDRYNRYVEKLGHEFTHLHHYCQSVAEYLRLIGPRVDKSQRDLWIQSSIGGFDYVLTRTPPGYFVRLDIFRKMIVLYQRSQDPKAATEMAKSMLEEFPKAAESYIAAAALMLSLNQREQAVSLLDRGAEAASDKESIARAREVLLAPKK